MSLFGRTFGYHVTAECGLDENSIKALGKTLGYDVEITKYQTPEEVRETPLYNVESGDSYNIPEINETFVTFKKDGKGVAYARLKSHENSSPGVIRFSTKIEGIYKHIIEKLPTKCVIQSTPWRDLIGYNAEIEMKYIKADDIKKFLKIPDSNYCPASKRYIPSGIGRGWHNEYVHKPAKMTKNPGTWMDGMHAKRVDVFVYENSGKVVIRSHDINAMRYILNMLESHFGPESH